jgi:PadR family transcriptional regulator PadR
MRKFKKCLDEPHHYNHNVEHIMLGEFEYVLITTAAGLKDKAYGAAIRDAIESGTTRKCSIGALYTTIDRLEAKGLLRTWTGEATAERGGRAKRMVAVTPQGILEATQFYEAMMRISAGAAWATGGKGSAV